MRRYLVLKMMSVEIPDPVRRWLLLAYDKLQICTARECDNVMNNERGAD